MPARASRARFRVQHVARKPRGWRVRTKREGAHELRIAFPPGARRKGSGRLLEILHPKGERNPQCGLAGKNPAELVIFGNPSNSRARHVRGAAAGAPGHKPGCPCAICKNMRAAGSRLPNRKNRGSRNPRRFAGWKSFSKYEKGLLRRMHFKAPKDESEARAMREMLTKIDAINKRHGNPGEMQEAVALYQTFQGRDPSGVIEKQVSAALRMEYTALGDLDYLDVVNVGGERVRLDFSGDGVKLASAPNGAQLYLIGGRQSLDEKCLGKFTDDTSKDLFDLGEAVEVQYVTKKAPSFETTKYYHKFGEEHRGSELPRATYDAIRKQIFLFGGEYRIEAPGIIN